MSTEPNLNHVGKRLPYRVPDGYFDTVEDSVMQEVKRCQLQPAPTPCPKSKFRLRLAATALAVSIAAAVVVGFFILTPSTKTPVTAPQEQATSIAQVEQAFNELSTEDQDYLVSVYEDDVFMDDIINSQNTEEQ